MKECCYILFLGVHIFFHDFVRFHTLSPLCLVEGLLLLEEVSSHLRKFLFVSFYFGDDRHATSGSATRASRFLTGLVTHALPGFAPGGPQPPILPPKDSFLFLDRNKFHA